MTNQYTSPSLLPPPVAPVPTLGAQVARLHNEVEALKAQVASSNSFLVNQHSAILDLQTKVEPVADLAEEVEELKKDAEHGQIEQYVSRAPSLPRSRVPDLVGGIAIGVVVTSGVWMVLTL